MNFRGSTPVHAQHFLSEGRALPKTAGAEGLHPISLWPESCETRPLLSLRTPSRASLRPCQPNNPPPHLPKAPVSVVWGFCCIFPPSTTLFYLMTRRLSNLSCPFKASPPPAVPSSFHVSPKDSAQTRAPCEKPPLMVSLTSFYHVSPASTVTKALQ